MRVNRNLSAVITNNQLHQNEDFVSASMERLSSGLRINHSQDDPSGMAISDRMTTQIDGLKRASDNANDATSLLETADGALNEMSGILQRMRELAVQAANDTNADEDRVDIQKEIEELMKEIDRMSGDTEFNSKKLLDGALDHRVYSSKHVVDQYGLYQNDFTRISSSDEVPTGKYRMNIHAGSKSTLQGGTWNLTQDSTKMIGENAAGDVFINGYKISIDATDTYASAWQKMVDGAAYGETTLTIEDGKAKLTALEAGSASTISVSVSNSTLENLIGNLTNGKITAGTDAKVELIPNSKDERSMFSDSATAKAEGNHITIKDSGGFEISFMINDNFNPTQGETTQLSNGTPVTTGAGSSTWDGTSGTVIGIGTIITSQDDLIDIENGWDSVAELDVTSLGTLQVQVGANENQTVNLRIPKLDLDSLYIDKLNVTTVNGAGKAIASLDEAIRKMSEARARIGAYENRMDHTVQSLDQSVENLNTALSRIQDADMAEEMTKYTQYNVLVQASTSVLAQANDQPESVLQLLQ